MTAVIATVSLSCTANLAYYYTNDPEYIYQQFGNEYTIPRKTEWLKFHISTDMRNPSLMNYHSKLKKKVLNYSLLYHRDTFAIYIYIVVQHYFHTAVTCTSISVNNTFSII